MIGQNSLIHVNLRERVGLDIIPSDTIPFSPYGEIHVLL